ncbi:Major facilitator superfamily domain, general substrate transporter [Niveomyces insectorum RCEF 264]|uniref:Major facilitator superfamily domain, general substrate transporter n=1 Tax=Niveomyces insectorum RCEF 264 TaxID=1081102 RepID=A0A167RD84_9HYPO|nr:Major facilitator superfamily domain, general substrate transporter [Niveomyces insectorum RCEF 264]
MSIHRPSSRVILRAENEVKHGSGRESIVPENGIVSAEETKESKPRSSDNISLDKGIDLLSTEDLDPVLNLKMHLVNDAIDEIGWTPYHWKLFLLTGFGYAVDSLIILLQSIIATSAFTEFGGRGYAKGLTVAVYVGMLTGALFWGLSADIVGRRVAFNVSLFLCSLACIVAGAMPSWASLGVFVALLGFGGGGNLVLDTTVFLEYLPGRKQWALTLLAAWWGVGQAVAGFIAWGFMAPASLNCATSGAPCTRQNNMGWRCVMFTSGALVLVMSLLRVTVVRLQETPKYLLGRGADAALVATLQGLATRYGRPCSLTAATLEACGVVRSDATTQHGPQQRYVSLAEETLVHLRGLFATRAIAVSTLLVWLSWTLIGLAYPLFYVFLNAYLASRGAVFHVSTYATWRNYALVNVSGIFGPVLAAWLCEVRVLGRRYTMVIGALATCAFFFAYTAVRTEPQNVAFSCSIGFCLNVFYGTLYAYTPEVLPSAHRATGNGVAVACNRVMGILSAVIATVANTSTSAPIYVCAALFIAMALVSALLPFEPRGRRSS